MDDPTTRRDFLSLWGGGALAALALGRRAWAAAERSPVRKPPRLQAGDTVGVVSPAGITYDSVDLDVLEETLTALGLRMKLDPHALDRWGYLAGSDEARAKAVNAMFADPEVAAVFALRGGWGSARILPLLDYELIAKNPKVFLGFSDITVLLLAFYARSGLVTFHGRNAASRLKRDAALDLKRLLFAGEALTFENPRDPGEYLVQVDDRIRTITPGKARGRLVGGNLTVLAGIVGSGYLPDFSGHVLFLEDVDEDVYRVDRMLTQLRLAGVLDQVTGFVFGRCSRCKPDSAYSSFTLEEVLTQHVAPLGVPAWHGARIGHIPDPFTVPVGVEVEVDADAGTITMLEPAVA